MNWNSLGNESKQKYFVCGCTTQDLQYTFCVYSCKTISTNPLQSQQFYAISELWLTPPTREKLSKVATSFSEQTSMKIPWFLSVLWRPLRLYPLYVPKVHLFQVNPDRKTHKMSLHLHKVGHNSRTEHVDAYFCKKNNKKHTDSPGTPGWPGSPCREKTSHNYSRKITACADHRLLFTVIWSQ